MKKILFGILCILLSIFMMSHNVNAVDYSVNVQRFCYIRSSDYFARRWGNNGPNSTTLSLDGPNSWFYLYLTGNIYSGCSNAQRGDIIQINFTLANMNENNSLDAYVWSFADDYNGSNKAWSFIDYEFNQLDASNSSLKLYYAVENTSEVIKAIDIVPVGSRIGSLYQGETIIFNNVVMYRPVSATDVSGVENAVSGSTQAINSLKDSIKEQNQKEDAAVNNIENQTPDNISNSGGSGENSSTTNLIGLLSNFVSALSGLNATNCDLVLAFPDYAGGSRTVNICQNKDKAGNLITVFSSLTMIMFYVPLAIKLLTMIYNEIRSFTNG